MVIEADVYKAPMFMALKIPQCHNITIPQYPRKYRNMAASTNDSKLHVLKRAYGTKVSLHQTSLHKS